MGLVGLFFGAMIGGVYSDKFGRKNAIWVFMGLLVVFIICTAFMPNYIGFLLFRTLTTFANVS
jgi:OCT family organic cation transporter-like MFS transporter 4/5